MITKIIDNFTSHLTRNNIGDITSGLAKYETTFGADPFSNITNLTWLEAPIQIDPTGAVITDLIMAQQPRLENGITYVYAIGHTGRLYKIQVNDPTTYNPNYDNPVLLTTLTIGSPTFKYGSSIQFYGTTLKLFIGHDLGVTSVNFDGTGEAAVGITDATHWIANVPRPSVNFQGVTYWGNGNNIAAIDSTLTVTTYTKLSPAFPSGTYVRDTDVSPDGNYAQIVVSAIPQTDMTSTVQDTSALSSASSYRFLWNGTDNGYTSFESYNAYSLNSNITFGPYSYTMGYDLGGAAVYTAGSKIISLPASLSPNFAAMFSTGNMMGFGAPETASTFLQASILLYGQYDFEVSKGLYRFLRLTATAPQTDIIQMPVCTIVSNLFFGSSSAGYAGNQVGSAKLYFSTLETNSAPTTKYRLYKFTTVPTGLGNAIQGVYETQNETSFKLFRSILKDKLKILEVRLFTEPLIANNSFQFDLVGVDGNPIPGATIVWTVGTNCAIGDTVVKFTPQMQPVPSLGVRITNLGTKNWVCTKIELDSDGDIR